MPEEFDVVVAGGGHNSLIAAAYLAKAGQRCLVLEAMQEAGGDASSQELTLPGFLHDTCSTAHNLLQSSPIIRREELGLAGYGLTYLHPDPVVHVPFPDGSWLTQWRDADRTYEEFAKFDRRDAAALHRMLAGYADIAPLVSRYRYTPAGEGEPLAQLLAGHPRGAWWRREDAMSAWDAIEREFADEHTRAFMLWMSFMTMQPPDRPGTGLLAYSLAFGRQQHSWTLPQGGSAALPRALCRLIEDHGGVVRTGATVARLIVEGGGGRGARCTGVELATGECLRAGKAVLSTIHIKHLVDMAPPALWGEEFRARVDAWQPGVSMFVTHYATTKPPRFAAGETTVTPVASGTPHSAARMLRVGADFRAGRVATDDPVLLVLCPTVADASRAPAGHHTLKVVGFQPYELPGGPERWDEIRDEVSAANLALLRRYAPDLADDVILASNIKSPLDLERFNGHNWHGSCHGGDMTPAQSGRLRPAAGWANHRMPIPGLYQTGATTHPGGSVSGAPGRNAAAVILGDLGTTLAAVIGT
ncbi:MAG TPA: NAD(P)/FAD-dependent oxidoreductase [Streptosporangiaceae bacterium]|nr:NAD(P)/FAD-dependent oxidoreductase [Streptosporangiaceae bacterium]